jgi:pimeloyl-ACP methyl ester carboxylesterase
MTAFANTDFREDLTKVNVSTLVLHGDSDATVPYEGSGQQTHETIPGSQLHPDHRRTTRLQRQQRR